MHSIAGILKSKKFLTYLFLTFFCGFSFLLGTAFAAGKGRSSFKTKCYKDNFPIETHVCVTEPKNGAMNGDTVYFFHGLNGNERDWEKREFAIEIQKHWSDSKKRAPRVITVSLGQFWILTESNESDYSGLLPLFENEILPRIESKLGKTTGRRIGIGTSMGGANLTSLVLSNPDLFEKSALLCPAIFNLSPYASLEEVHQYISETGANRLKVELYLNLTQQVFPDHATWEAYNPLVQIKTRARFLNQLLPPHYVSANEGDEYGIFSSTSDYRVELEKFAAKTIWQPSNGGHCKNLNTQAIADFLID